ncbi:MAG: hypothetical protein D6714_04945 [Bacteroidetes bacterium]|nr:MAG: hypothetical protein D6714_04945 [Bacteroidota bacterium]
MSNTIFKRNGHGDTVAYAVKCRRYKLFLRALFLQPPARAIARQKVGQMTGQNLVKSPDFQHSCNHSENFVKQKLERKCNFAVVTNK